MPVDTQAILDASQALNRLAKAYEMAGEMDYAERLFRSAADLELASPELQQCWGGPFNGQVGRQVLMLDLLRLLNPAAVIETGSFRGVSTEWFAQRYPGPVISCESEKLHFLQAQARLAGYSNVDLRLDDSRRFLNEIFATMPTNRPILVYLDAHSCPDLPLREELEIVVANQPNAVVVIDDFRVPDDPGYAWDDYGPHLAIDLTLVADAIPDNARLFFPAIKSSEETGVRRGCCVVARDSASIAEQSRLLRGGTLAAWKSIQERSRN